MNHCQCPSLRHWTWKLLKYLLLLAFVLGIAAGIARIYQFWDKDPDRGALPLPEPDKFGERFDKVVYLKEQTWDAADSLWFYTITQGSDLLPYDFFLSLEQKDKIRSFRDNMNMNNYRYLPQKPTFSNPDGLPVGFVADTYRGVKYLGLTCAACHTGQINYKGTAMRIDGGPAGADMETFVADLGKAMVSTLNDAAKLERFSAAVLKLGSYQSGAEVKKDLATYAQRVNNYVAINNPTTPYRYGRLDAFGRIYNRVLEHVMSPDQLEEVLAEKLSPEELAAVMKGIKGVMSQQDRDHIVARIQQFLTPKQQLQLRNALFNRANAPVSYPFLWDIPQHDYVQWNGIGANAGVGPLGRNAGEVMGVFGTLDWQKKPGWTLSSALGGQGWFTSSHIDYQSSANVHNLRRIEHQLESLTSPKWPESILGKLDDVRVARGNKLFAEYCEQCHDEIDRASKERRVVARMTRLEVVKTDPQMAENSVTYAGYSGILRNLYVGTEAGNILIQSKTPVAALLTKADQNVLVTPDPDKWMIRSVFERAYDFITTLRDNEVQTSIKQGEYTPDTTATPFASLRAYKGRSLNGIWATAPYLHNGSVPTLYDLLLPKQGECVAADGEYRPDTFRVGSREYDPVKGGLHADVGDVFETSHLSNHNTGHNYGGCDEQPDVQQPDKKLNKALTREERLDLLEYMKSL